MALPAVATEGGLLPADLLDALAAAADLPGQDPAAFGLDAKTRLPDHLAALWGAALKYWDLFRFHQEQAKDTPTTITRRRWVIPLLELLGYSLIATPAARTIGTATFALSHTVGPDAAGPPLHIQGYDTPLDQRPPSGRPRLSAHALMQEYLNAADHRWGIITNGLRLRLLRDSARLARPAYVEFDLNAIFEGRHYASFALLVRLLHRSRLPLTPHDAEPPLLERYHQDAIAQGGRVREKLREGVVVALTELGQGLVAHPANAALRAQLADGTLTPLALYRELLRLVYRLLFLLVAEDRGLLAALPAAPNTPTAQLGDAQKRLELFLRHYAPGYLRTLAEHRGTVALDHDDLWLRTRTAFRMLRGDPQDTAAARLGIAPLGGRLFGPEALPTLEGTLADPLGTPRLSNRRLLAAIGALARYQDEDGTWRRVNYAALDVEELGSVYESLLDYQPRILAHADGLRFVLATGTERRTTGSYYTHPELVAALIERALAPVVAARVAAAGPEQAAQEEALLSISVCDPACGSGHFVLAAARYLATRLATIRTGEPQADPATYRAALREVIGHCVYGVDLNPLAVELCQVALWIESYVPGAALSFLDHHIKWGNSLVGATQELVEAGIPEDAYKAVSGDDRALSSLLRRERRRHETQASLFELLDAPVPVAQYEAIDALPDTTTCDAEAKAAAYAQLRASPAVQAALRRANLWTAAFFTPLTAETEALIPRMADLAQLKTNPATVTAKTLAADALAEEAALRFFHWELEYPQVFADGGFAVILGNPPWERIKLQEQEHWADVAEIAEAPNAARRQTAIRAYATSSDPAKQARYALFERAKYLAEALSRFVRASGRFPLTAVGDVNTYALFAELNQRLTQDAGRTGMIVPTGIATDDTTKAFFADVTGRNRLVSLADFENREKLFADVDSRFKFALLTLGATTQPAELLFFATNVGQLDDERRTFTLTPQEIALLNPNTRTAPVFRTQADAELTKRIYRAAPILDNERTGESPWGITFITLFHKTNDFGFFLAPDTPNTVPLYEGDLVFQYDHRFATYDSNLGRSVSVDDTHKGADFAIQTEYAIDRNVFLPRIEGRWTRPWFFGIRRIARNTDKRTLLGAFIPHRPSTYGLYCFLSEQSTINYTVLAAMFNSLTLDYFARHGTGQPSLTYTVLKQLPVLPPSAFTAGDLRFIVPRVAELVYTSWDMAPWFADLWAEADGELRELLAMRHAQCNEGAGPEFAPRPEAPLPPFRWDEERRAWARAQLDARIARRYGLSREDLRYILDPQAVYGADFPGETFRVLKANEERAHGHYRTERLVLRAWDEGA